MDSRQRIRIAVALFFFVSGFGFATWASRIPAIQTKLNLSDASLGSILFSLPLGLILTLPVTGMLLQKYSSKYIMFTGALAFNAMLAFIGFASQPWHLAVALFLFGSSRNLMNISVNAQSIGVQALYDTSIITTFHGIWSVAGFLGAATGSLMVAFDFPPSIHFFISGLAMIIVCFIGLPNTLNEKPNKKEGSKSFILPDRSLLKFGLISFASMSIEGTMYDWSGIYFQKVVHASKDVVTLGYVVYMIAMTAGRFLGDRLINVYGVPLMLKISGILTFLGLMTAALFPSPLVAGFGFMLTGFGVSCITPLVFSLAGKNKSMSGGAAIASISTVGYFGFLVLPPLIGYISHMAGLRWAFAIIALFGAMITIMMMTSKIEQDEESTKNTKPKYTKVSEEP